MWLVTVLGPGENCWRSCWLRQWNDLEWTRFLRNSLFLVLMSAFLRRGKPRYTVAFRNICLLFLSLEWSSSAHLLCVTSPPSLLLHESFPSTDVNLFSYPLTPKGQPCLPSRIVWGKPQKLRFSSHSCGSWRDLGNWKECIEEIKSLLNLALERVYMKSKVVST